MSFKIIVTVKQVPDTHNVSGDAMKPDGTVNRAALPTIFNPEDLNALEEALLIKDRYGAHITVVTMGPVKAVEVLKESLFRGADDAILLSDRRFAGADTLATSYVLQKAIEKVGKFDLILCGRQAIDGDTAQVGPQIAEKLGINQLTCITGVLDIIDREKIVVKRSIEGGHEIIRSQFPVLLTVTNEANNPRSQSAKKVMAYKNVTCIKDHETYDDLYLNSSERSVPKIIKEWNLDSIGADENQCGLGGSPTRVKKIQNVVLTACDTKMIDNTEASIKHLIHSLVDEHILG